MSTHFFAVGVREYHDPSLDLTRVDASIEKLAAYISTHWPDAIVDDAADLFRASWDHAAVENVLDRKLRLVNADDAVVVYWVGHGDDVGSHELLLSDSRILTRQVAKWLLACPAKDVVLLLDCCWAQSGIDDMIDEAKEIEKDEGPDELEQTITVLVSARRNERASDGALIDAMMRVLDEGPHPMTSPRHRWTQADDAITADSLADAVNAVFRDPADPLDQKAFAQKLRATGAGRLFPSPWHGRTAANGESGVPATSVARRQAVKAFERAEVVPPADWTRAGLLAYRAVADGAADEGARAHLGGIFDALVLALDAEQLAHQMITGSLHRLSEPALRAALRAAVGEWTVVPTDVRFDLFHAVAERRGRRADWSPVEAEIAFVARLYMETGGEGRPDALYRWAADRNAGRFIEPHVVNKICDTAESDVDRRLVIDLGAGWVPDDALPTIARGQIYADGVAVGEPVEEPIEPVGLEATKRAIAKLVEAKRRDGFAAIDIIVPESLLFLEPEDVNVTRLRYSRRLVEEHRVALRYGGRFHPDTRWEGLIERYRALVGGPPRWRRVEEAELDSSEAFFDEVEKQPVAVAFNIVPRGDERAAALALLAALDGTSVVVWPTSDQPPARPVDEIAAERWLQLPTDVAEARRSTTKGEQSDDLARLRVVWEDEQWLALARRKASYESEG